MAAIQQGTNPIMSANLKHVYLAGSITKLDREVARDWRIAVTDHFKIFDEWKVLDPTLLEARLQDTTTIVRFDYGCILQSKVIIADIRVPSWGTAMEIAFAHMNRVPVIGWGKPTHKSPWLIHHVPVILPDPIFAADHVLENF